MTLGRRGENVRGVIRALFQRDLPRQDFELVLVDRTPDRWYSSYIAAMASDTGTSHQYLVSDNWSRAHAQNIGFGAAANEVVLFLCEDFEPPHSLFGLHLGFHRRNPEPWRAVTGPAARASGAQTPLTRRLERDLAPFHPPAGANAGNISPFDTNFANLSLKRAFLLENGVFDGGYPTEGFDDIDLALRLHARGLRVAFDPALQVTHQHDVDLREHLLRWELTARGARHFDARHPGVRLNREPQDATVSIARARLACAASWLATLGSSGAAARERYYLKRTQLAFARGYRALPGPVAYPHELD
jgi:hypothetical protein